MDLSIITVTWNSRAHIAEQIHSVALGCKDIHFEQIVVDNGSNDGTVELVKNEFPHIQVIANVENKGFAAANNQAITLAQGKFLLFLNPDMRIEAGSLDNMVSWMESHRDVGVASCKLVHPDGSINQEAGPRQFPTLRDQVLLLLKVHHLFPKILDQYHMRDFDPTKEQKVDSVRGSFLLVRRELVETVGFAFDPRYYIWFEDVDLCREACRHGYAVMYTPIISCVDYVGQSFKKQASVWKQKQFTKSMLRYFQKWEPWWRWVWIALLRPFGIALTWVRERVRA